MYIISKTDFFLAFNCGNSYSFFFYSLCTRESLNHFFFSMYFTKTTEKLYKRKVLLYFITLSQCVCTLYCLAAELVEVKLNLSWVHCIVSSQSKLTGLYCWPIRISFSCKMKSVEILEISSVFMQRMTKKKGTRMLKKCVQRLKCRSSSIYNLLRNHYKRDE